MPATINYNLGKIYKIVDNTNGNIYIGSTCKKTLAQRLATHKEDYKRFLAGKRNSVTSFRILENGNCDIILLESVPCASKDELHARERFYIENNECVNIVVPLRTRKEYVDQTKEQRAIKQKQYDAEHKDTIKIRKHNYREEHKEVFAEKCKNYYQNNIMTISAEHACGCGMKYTHHHKARHIKTAKHQNWLATQEPVNDIV